MVVTSDNVSEHLDDKKQPIFMTKDTLGTGIDNLLADTGNKTRLHEAVANASSALTKANTASTDATSALSVANAAQTTANTASTDASSALNKANNATSSIETLETNAVTRDTLTQDLYDKLSAGGTCGTQPTSTDNLKSLLNGTFEVCTFTPKQ